MQQEIWKFDIQFDASIPRHPIRDLFQKLTLCTRIFSKRGTLTYFSMGRLELALARASSPALELALTQVGACPLRGWSSPRRV
jgi:hypothetical protein